MSSEAYALAKALGFLDVPEGDFVAAIEDPVQTFVQEQKFGKLPTGAALDKTWDEPMVAAPAEKRSSTLSKVVRCEKKTIDGDEWNFLYDGKGELVDARVILFRSDE